ncbi:MAG: hypothetical protein ACE5JZ_00080 [Kiloniellales bacterium]
MTKDAWLFAIVFLVWLVLSVLYYTVPMIYMPTTGRVWGLGALLFLVLAAVVLYAQHKGKSRRAAAESEVAESRK